jgi:N-acetylneuraminate synthase
MIDDAAAAGCECVKFQCHIVEDEMVPAAKATIPANATESIWDIMARCALDESAERALMAYTREKGMVYLSTPFSRAAAIRLAAMGVPAFKIGSGECNNYPLIQHIASYNKPVIVSTGMNDLTSIAPAVSRLREARVPIALMHCTSLYPTPYEKVRLGAMAQLADAFPDAVIGFSDHSLSNWCSLAATALGASILERHFTSDKSWPGPDIAMSMGPEDLRDLIQGSRAIHAARGGQKDILPEEQATIDFAYSSVVTTRTIAAGEVLSGDNIWVKRPGTGAIRSVHFPDLLGRFARHEIPADAQLDWNDVE